ncbi:hypothetical protein CLAFUW4_08771 [Fulvia fulva]|uniref:Uncharacterized protein n=1 Tax=Passalora fulva TaxID=5499 RepID=A0A9Q8UTU5_PASFU|nr:uncharacterized protein CLAFUR5_08871 [Fulvia fulva]KAK4614239.1 hypothetical protein CLAFUR4_08776 [Fulvia fulva]KAK4615215.1 hypothetical protein CLAFUR0_08771 [Fulvia fulva]UJO22178.1 hypothetical protein CLAFUR5_08871 [Fulvia fulva]WPV19915.1 hypothetical protein CLAFUW4_08771 [Fulvia fulva]WPV35486.1 hypothetical protein CLAFUW7_08771 [Fulvia fulva]
MSGSGPGSNSNNWQPYGTINYPGGIYRGGQYTSSGEAASEKFTSAPTGQSGIYGNTGQSTRDTTGQGSTYQTSTLHSDRKDKDTWRTTSR